MSGTVHHGDSPLIDEAILPGVAPGTALRVAPGGSREDCVHLERLAYSPSAGWYVERSLCLDRSMAQGLGRTLLKAECLLSRPSDGGPAVPDLPRILPGPGAAPGTPCLRRA